jgi:hypothetical protein
VSDAKTAFVLCIPLIAVAVSNLLTARYNARQKLFDAQREWLVTLQDNLKK